jgi:hypothetical protein
MSLSAHVFLAVANISENDCTASSQGMQATRVVSHQDCPHSQTWKEWQTGFLNVLTAVCSFANVTGHHCRGVVWVATSVLFWETRLLISWTIGVSSESATRSSVESLDVLRWS